MRRRLHACDRPRAEASRASTSAMPQAASASRVSCPALAGRRRGRASASVREKRGAGAGWVIPSRSTNVPRAARCGCSKASLSGRTGRRRRPSAAKTSTHSAWVRPRDRLGDQVGGARRGCAGSLRSGTVSAMPSSRDQLVVERAARGRRPRGAGRPRSRRRRRTARRRRAGWRRAPRGSSPWRKPGGHGVQVGGAVDDRGVDDLALARDAGPRAGRRGCRSRGTSSRRRSRRRRLLGNMRPGGVLAHAEEGAGDRDVAEVVPGGRARAGRPGPSRSSGRRPGAGCGPGSRRVRARAARWCPGAGPRPARRPAPPGRARSRRRRDA